MVIFQFAMLNYQRVNQKGHFEVERGTHLYKNDDQPLNLQDAPGPGPCASLAIHLVSFRKASCWMML